MINKSFVFGLIDEYFQTRNAQIKISQQEEIVPLLNTNILTQTDSIIEVDANSISFNEIFLDYLEEKTNQKIPTQIKDALTFVDNFEKQKKKEFGNSNIINAYSRLIDGVKSYIFYLFHTKGEINIIDYFKSLKKTEQRRSDKYLIQALLWIEDIDEETIYNLLSLLQSDQMGTQVPYFCQRIGNVKPSLANNLYNYAIKKKDKNDFYILSNLLMGLYDVEADATLSKVKDLTNINSSIAYFTLGRLKYVPKEHILESFELANKVSETNIECLLQVPYIYKTLIENKNTPNDIKEKCFEKMSILFSIENKQLRDSIFVDCRFIEGHEEARFNIFVNTFLSKSQDYYERIDDYFGNFANPIYFFNLFERICLIKNKNGIHHPKVDIFKTALSHFWNVNREQTEIHLLNLLSDDISSLRIGAVDLIRSRHWGFYEVNLLSLNSEIKQLRAIEALLFRSFYNIESFLPLILSLRNSPYKKVVAYLQQRLSDLILNSYHELLYERITEQIQDESFLNPLKESIDLYHQIREIKTSINDLNPQKNEYNLMDLYYNLEHEEHQKLMTEIRNGDKSFLSMIKSTIIVRGHSWKIKDNEVRPLGKIEHSFSLDLNMYKNPDLFDYKYNLFNSEF